MEKYYPKIKFEVRLMDGSLLKENESINSQMIALVKKEKA
jgi:hypothetical protein